MSWPVNPSYWNFTRSKYATNSTWIDVSSYSDGDGPGASLGALITLPHVTVNDAYRSDNFWDVSQQSYLISCLINAKWAASKIQYESKSSKQIDHNIIEPSVFVVNDDKNEIEIFKRSYGLSDTIHIASEWAALLNVAGIKSVTATGESINATMMEGLLSQFVITGANPIYSPYMAVDAEFITFAPPQIFNVVSATSSAVID